MLGSEDLVGTILTAADHNIGTATSSCQTL